MRKKFIDKVYMRDVLEKEWYLEQNEEFGGYIALKYLKKVKEPSYAFCNGKEYVGIDDGYTILEYVPSDKGYNCRVFFDKINRPMCYYFDINNGNGVEDGMPWYDDLYLDVTMECPAITESCYFVRLDDQKEFAIAKEEGKVDDDTYAKGYATAKQLMLELRAQTNFIVNRSLSDLYRIKAKLGLN